MQTLELIEPLQGINGEPSPGALPIAWARSLNSSNPTFQSLGSIVASARCSHKMAVTYSDGYALGIHDGAVFLLAADDVTLIPHYVLAEKVKSWTRCYEDS